MVKLGNVEFEKEEIMKYFFEEDKKFIVQYRSVYQIFYSKNAGFSAIKAYYYNGNLPLTKKGRFFIWKAEDVNRLLGVEKFVD